jgi:hypothetical protein
VVVKLEPVGIEEYARVVLPETFELWGGTRDFESYVEDFREIATSAYGKRRPFTVGLRESGTLVSSCKNYDRELRWKGVSLRATGIGAVFTPERLRGHGFASVMLGALLDSEAEAGRDLAFLYSDIHPAYYERLGFIALPSRVVTLRASSLDGSPAGAQPLAAQDWAGVRRCFESLEALRPWGFRRTPLVWDWMRRGWAKAPPSGTQSVQLVVKRGRSLIAYAIGRRVLREDTFVVDDFAFEGEAGRAIVPALLRAGAGDLRRVGGWLPPSPARDVLPRASVRARKKAVLMIAPVSRLGRAWWAQNKDGMLAGRADATWSADHV